MKLIFFILLLCFLAGCSGGGGGDNAMIIPSPTEEVRTVKQTETIVVEKEKEEEEGIYAWAHDRDKAYELYKQGKLPKYDNLSLSQLKKFYNGWIFSQNDDGEFGIFYSPNGLLVKSNFQVE